MNLSGRLWPISACGKDCKRTNANVENRFWSAMATDLFSKNEFVPIRLKKAAREGIIVGGGSCG
jgi:hypothetical protein